jgi:hypothetical protein
VPEILREPVDVRAYFSAAHNRIDLYAKVPMGVMVAERKRVAEGDEHPRLLSLSLDEAQRLMDMLWEAGIKPAGAAGSAGQAEAMRSHIADLQKVVDRLLPAKA